MNSAIIIVLLVLAFFLFSRTEHFWKNGHLTKAYLIHEATADQCYECRAIRNYFYSALGDQEDLELYSYHSMYDAKRVIDLRNKYGIKTDTTPVLLVVHDHDVPHGVFYGYPAVHQAITSLRYHPYIERRLDL
jgi:hypothetical protein